jgi:hypothetical protein
MLLALGCDRGGPIEPNLTRAEVAGSYRVVELAFDPQGNLPEADIRARLASRGKPDPSLALIESGAVQLLFEDPGSTLLRLVEGTYLTTPTGVTIDFGPTGAIRFLLLPRNAAYERALDGSLSVQHTGTVSRASLITLVPDWAAEPLLDPMPGTIRVTFARAD